MAKARLVLIGVGEPYRGALRSWCQAQRVSPLEIADAASLPSLEGSCPLLCLLALRSDREASPDRIRSLRKWLATSPLVVLACGIGIDCAVQLIRMGVVDVIEANGPVEDVVARVTRHAGRGEGDEDLVGGGPAMRRLREEIAAVGHLTSTVLLKGETGVGKSNVARAIHRISRRRSGPFVHVDCASLPAGSADRELFGTAEGTGPTSDTGSLRAAMGGTLFLDEIGDLDFNVQARLLRILERRDDEEIEGIGGSAGPARLIAATSRDLQADVGRGRFRADLYFRLNVFPLSVPPLRDRLSDIGALVQVGFERLGSRLGVTPPHLSPTAYEAMAAHSWPGNVRELMSLLERVLVRHHAGLFDESQLVAALGPSPGAVDRSGVEEGPPASRAAVAGALIATGGNIARAARRLGVARTTLRYRISVLGLESFLPRD